MKECSKCKELKPKTEFYKHKHMADGLQSYCKSCLKQASKSWDSAHPRRRQELKAALQLVTTELERVKGYHV